MQQQSTTEALASAPAAQSTMAEDVSLVVGSETSATLPEEMQALYVSLQRHTVRQRYWTVAHNVFYTSGLSLFVVFGVWHLVFHNTENYMRLIMNTTMVSNFALMAITTLATTVQDRRGVVQRTANLNDKRFAGLLCECLQSDNFFLRAAAKQALTVILPALHASDGPLLNRAQRTCLYKAMTVVDGAFTVAALKALEQIGDTKALPVVQKLAQRKMKNKTEQTVVEAARACLPFLEERVEREQGSGTLLRAASPETNPDTLLRAAGQSQTPPNELLRKST